MSYAANITKTSDSNKWIGGQIADHAAMELIVGLEPTTMGCR